MPAAQHSGLVRADRHGKTGPELLQNPLVKDGKSGSQSLCAGTGETK